MTHRAYATGLLILFTAASLASAQSWGPRGLDELKEETLRRALHGEGPIGTVRMEDAERAVAALHDLERDTWPHVRRSTPRRLQCDEDFRCGLPDAVRRKHPETCP